MVVPHVTASYADGPKDQVDDAIPMCTLRNFPSLTEHCIEWARRVGVLIAFLMLLPLRNFPHTTVFVPNGLFPQCWCKSC